MAFAAGLADNIIHSAVFYPPSIFPSLRFIQTVLRALCASFVILVTAAGQPACANPRPSPSFLGPMGLNTVPSARMDPHGTARMTISTLDPYAQALLSFQPADWLNLSLRQSAEISGLNDDADRLYPGLDLKLRLMKEEKYQPELSIGLLSAFGHKRMAGEYVALSKRYHDFDFTAGLGWGRYGSSGTFDNPLKVLSDHFSDPRPLDGEMPNGPEDWFTGNDVGLFGGVEYFTPVRGLSLKLDWGADRFIAEKTAFDFNVPNPWSVGVNYAPTDWMDLGVGVMGSDKIMATLSLNTLIQKWPGRSSEKTKTPPLRGYRTGIVNTGQMQFDAIKYSQNMVHDIRRNDHTVWARVETDPMSPIPFQIGRAARHIANHAGEVTEEILVTPEIYTLHGAPVRIMRRDLEQAAIRNQGSASELWNNASLNAPIPPDLANGPDVNSYGDGTKRMALNNVRFILDLQTSLSEEDSGVLYRTSGIVDFTMRLWGRWLGNIAVRANGPDNLDGLDDIRPQALLPVRSNVQRFADKTVSIDRLYETWLKSSPSGNWHYMASMGYLEEMYAAYGGEVLYRPAGKTWALGAESWYALKRDPDTFLNLGLNGDHLITGHVKGWYEIPQTDLTIGVKLGRYLAEDLGGTVSLTKSMSNGMAFEAFMTATDNADYDLFGGTTHLYSGLKFTMPIGNVAVLPRGSHIRASALPLGRDTGQSIDNPMPLYTLTDPISTRAMIRDWGTVTE